MPGNHVARPFTTVHPVPSQGVPQACPLGLPCLPAPLVCVHACAAAPPCCCACADHTARAVAGYVIYSRKQKLRPELAGLPSAEIRRRKLAGEVRRQAPVLHACAALASAVTCCMAHLLRYVFLLACPIMHHSHLLTSWSVCKTAGGDSAGGGARGGLHGRHLVRLHHPPRQPGRAARAPAHHGADLPGR